MVICAHLIRATDLKMKGKQHIRARTHTQSLRNNNNKWHTHTPSLSLHIYARANQRKSRHSNESKRRRVNTCAYLMGKGRFVSSVAQWYIHIHYVANLQNEKYPTIVPRIILILNLIVVNVVALYFISAAAAVVHFRGDFYGPRTCRASEPFERRERMSTHVWFFACV